jgi:hypothetical protein
MEELKNDGKFKVQPLLKLQKIKPHWMFTLDGTVQF